MSAKKIYIGFQIHLAVENFALCHWCQALNHTNMQLTEIECYNTEIEP